MRTPNDDVGATLTFRCEDGEKRSLHGTWAAVEEIRSRLNRLREYEKAHAQMPQEMTMYNPANDDR